MTERPMTTNSADEARAPVIQADRELFIYLLGFDVVPNEEGFQRILDGKFDHWEKMRALARHRLSHASAVGMPSREDVARVIDPDAWAEIQSEDQYPANLKRIADRRAASLAKADAILALFPAQTDGGECD